MLVEKLNKNAKNSTTYFKYYKLYVYLMCVYNCILKLENVL